MTKQFALAVLALSAVTACSENRDLTAPPPGPNSTTIQADQLAGTATSGSIYTLTNQIAGNAVAVFRQAMDGSLTAQGSVSTGGLGSGSSLGSQGSLTLSDNGRWLLAVNAGSNDVSVFKVTEDGLELTDRVASGGTRPISVTVAHNTVYALNAGGTGNISGFTLSEDGKLSPIAGSTRPLSGSAVNPAEVSFSTNGRWLVVTEKATNKLDVYAVDKSGVAGAPSFQSPALAGSEPFGFAFGRRNELVVSEAATGSASSYVLGKSGTLSLVTGAAATHQGAPCWVAVTEDGRFAYTANAASGTITGFSVSEGGSLGLLDASGVTATVNAGAIDIAVGRGSRFLYQLDGSRISAFRVTASGHLEPLGSIAKPTGSAGLAAL
ncbi:MAG TPA: beta-propeller fold lactonase family protein [Gemmatimonadaceae bacterium]|nr:beta-propeller fold lactonase family protein [Gemmatimonadaceae bacterium]